MNNDSIFQPLMVKIEAPSEEIKFNFKTKKSGFRPFKFPETKLQKKGDRLYEEMKSLKPFGKYTFPDSIFRNMSKDFDFGYAKGQHFYNTEYMKLTKLRERYSRLVKYHNVSGSVSFHDTEFFERFIVSNKIYNIAFFSFSLIMSGVENFIKYRERNSSLSYDDNIYFFELLFYTTKQYKEVPEEIREKFKKLYKNVDYVDTRDNICDIHKLENLTSNIENKLEAVIFDLTIFHYPYRKYSGYLSSQVVFNLFIFSFKKLKKNGLMKFKIRAIDNYIFLELISLVCNYFKEVYIFKSSVTGETVPHKEIICNGFEGASDNFIREMEIISQKWLSVNDQCGMKFNKEHKNFVYSILNCNKNIIPYIKKFNELELEKINYGFEKTIASYDYVKNYKDSAIEELLTIQLKKSLEWLKIHDIEVRAEYKLIDEKILSENEPIDFESMKYILKSGKDKESEIEDYYNKIGFITYLNRSVLILDQKKYNDIFKRTRKITLNQDQRIKEIEKIFGKDSEIMEFCLVSEKLDIIDKINNLYQSYKESYLYKSALTMYDTSIYFVGIDKLSKEKSKTPKFINFLTEILENIGKEIERIMFYYESPPILRNNKMSLQEMQRKNNKKWKKYFN